MADDARIFRIRNGLLILFAIFALLVMWANVIGLAGLFQSLSFVLLVICGIGLAHTVRMTGAETLLTMPLPMVLVGLLVAASLARFVYAMAYGD